MSAHILVVEDEPKIAAVLRDYLESSGFTTSTLARGDLVEGWLAANRADLLMLEGRNHFNTHEDCGMADSPWVQRARALLRGA